MQEHISSENKIFYCSFGFYAEKDWDKIYEQEAKDSTCHGILQTAKAIYVFHRIGGLEALTKKVYSQYQSNVGYYVEYDSFDEWKGVFNNRDGVEIVKTWTKKNGLL